jgi:dolichyl-phosphate-mannose--protein O-mannosyl transferase
MPRHPQHLTIARAEIGQHHRISVHLNAYAGEMAWREDHRRKDNWTMWHIVTGAALGHVESEKWCGYRQR